MRRQIVKNRSAISTMLVAAVVVIIVIAAVAGAYYLTLPKSSPSASPSPTATASQTIAPTSSPSETATPAASPTPNPSASTNPTANFKAGAYASYNMLDYSSGSAVSSNFKIQIGEDTISGTACWILTTTAGNDTDYVIIVENIAKANASQLVGNVTMKMYSAGTLLFDQSFDASNSTTGAGTTEVNPQTIVGQETVTVPAGTFDCSKAIVTSTNTAGQTETSTIWISQNVPAFGMVKAESTVAGAQSSTLELASYGGYP